MKRILFSIFTACCLAFVACEPITPDIKPVLENVFIIYSAGYNNLASNLRSDVEDFYLGDIPTADSPNAVVVVSHYPVSYSDYTTKTETNVVRLFKRAGAPVLDTLAVFEKGHNDCDADHLNKMLRAVKEMLPAVHYSMLLSSHGTGWLPENYSDRDYTIFSTFRHTLPAQPWPETKSVGAQFIFASGNKMEMDLKDFTNALPMHLDYLILDACLMGSVEVAYQLRNKCDYIIASPTEILTQGMMYETMAHRLFGGPTPDLQGVCEDYYNHYMAESGSFQSATIALYDCSKMEALAGVFTDILAKHPGAVWTVKARNVQGYFYDNKSWFYDLRDLVANITTDKVELARMDMALSDAVLYKAATDKFFDLKLERVCGISVYIPSLSRGALNKYYGTLDWGAATGLANN